MAKSSHPVPPAFVVDSINNDFLTAEAKKFVDGLSVPQLRVFASMSPKDRMETIIKHYVEDDSILEERVPAHITDPKSRKRIARSLAETIAGTITAPAPSSFYSIDFPLDHLLVKSIFISLTSFRDSPPIVLCLRILSWCCL